METIGERIKKLRLNNDLTLEELGNKIGVASQTINKYENGTITDIPLTKIKLLSEALNVTPLYIVGWEEERKQEETQEDKFVKLLIDKTLDGKIEWFIFEREKQDKEKKNIFSFLYNKINIEKIVYYSYVSNYVVMCEFDVYLDDEIELFYFLKDGREPSKENLDNQFKKESLIKLKNTILNSKKKQLNNLITDLENL